MTHGPLTAVAVVTLLLGVAGLLQADTCAYFPVHIYPADGSQPLASLTPSLLCRTRLADGTYVGGYGAVYITSIDTTLAFCPPASEGDISCAFLGNGYLQTPFHGGVECHVDRSNNQAICTGDMAIPIFAIWGNLSGSVTTPAGAPAPDTPVYVCVKEDGDDFYHYYGSFQTGPDGRYDIAVAMGIEPLSNNWGLPVHGDGAGKGRGDYYLTAHETAMMSTARCVGGVEATTFSSENVVVNLVKEPPPDPSIRSCPAAGEPVSVATGNVFFDQTDIEIPGLGGGLRFVRSYNSKNAAWGGSFGPGWAHSYEKTVRPRPEGGMVLRGEDGVPSLFADDGNGTITATAPFSKDSWFVQTANGYTRYFRVGGSETYDSQGFLTSVADPSGITTTLTRDGAGRLTAITDAGARR